MLHHFTIGQLTIAAIVFVVVAIAVVEYLKRVKSRLRPFAIVSDRSTTALFWSMALRVKPRQNWPTVKPASTH